MPRLYLPLFLGQVASILVFGKLKRINYSLASMPFLLRRTVSFAILQGAAGALSSLDDLFNGRGALAFQEAWNRKW